MTRILVGYDGSPHAKRAVDAAIQRAQASKGELLVVTAIPNGVRGSSLSAMMPAGVELPKPLAGTFEDHARASLDEVVAKAKAAAVPARGEVHTGPVVDVLLAAAKEFGAEEILLGVKSFEGPDQHVGPHAAEIARRSKVPVVLVP